MAALDAARRRTASRVLFGLAAGAAILGVALLWTGGFFTRVYGVRISTRGVRQVVVGQISAHQNRVDEGEPGFRSVAHGDRRGAIKLDHGRWIGPQQHIVQADYLRPVGRGRG